MGQSQRSSAKEFLLIDVDWHKSIIRHRVFNQNTWRPFIHQQLFCYLTIKTLRMILHQGSLSCAPVFPAFVFDFFCTHSRASLLRFARIACLMIFTLVSVRLVSERDRLYVVGGGIAFFAQFFSLQRTTYSKSGGAVSGLSR